MQISHSDALSATFAALADPTRRAILARLAQGDAPVGELVKPFPISGPAISRHLRVLENAQLIERKVDAQWRVCRLHAPGLQRANNWLSQYRAFWDDSLDQLVEVLEQADRPNGATPDTPRPVDHPPPASGTLKAAKPGARRAPNHHPRRKP